MGATRLSACPRRSVSRTTSWHRVALGRGDEPHVGLQHLRRADAHERAALEGTQELDLQVASGISVISSRKSVPPLVRSKRSPAGPKAWSRARARLATASG